MTIIPPSALNQHIAILGKTGSGKSYAAKGIVEQLLAEKRQVCILDPTSAWFGLRLGADGKSRGFDVVLLGGQHADIPLAERSGSAVARLVTEQGANVVLDTSGFTVGEYTRWFIDFAGTLFTTIRSPLHLVIDEAHHFMPQGKSPDVDAGRMLHAGNRLMSGGRSKGVRGLLITQRPAKLHKDSLSCADTLIAMRVIAPQDRAAIKEWIDGAGDPAQGKAVLDSLAQLPRGEGWVWYPEGGHLERVKFPRIKTYDSSATPAHGAKAGPKVSEIDLGEVRRAMADAVKEAEASDPKLLRAKIAVLEKQLRDKPPEPAEAKVLEVSVITDEQIAAMKPIVEQLLEASKSLGLTARANESVAVAWQKAIDNIQGRRTRNETPKILAGSRPTKPAENKRESPVKTRADHTQTYTGDLGKAERAILTAIYWLRDESITPAKVGFYADYSAGSGSFNNALGRLRSSGLLQGWQITPEGIALAESLGGGDKPTGEELREWLRRKLGKAENALLDALCESYPDRLSSEELGQASGYSAGSGSFNNALGRLRSIEAAVGYEREGGAKASDVFFE